MTIIRSVRRSPRRGVRKNRQEQWLESFAVSDQRPRSSTRGGLSCLPGRNYNTSEPPRGLPSPFSRSLLHHQPTTLTAAKHRHTFLGRSENEREREREIHKHLHVHLVSRAHLINSTVSTWRGIVDYQPGIDFGVGSDSRFTVHHFTRIRRRPAACIRYVRRYLYFIIF